MLFAVIIAGRLFFHFAFQLWESVTDIVKFFIDFSAESHKAGSEVADFIISLLLWCIQVAFVLTQFEHDFAESPYSTKYDADDSGWGENDAKDFGCTHIAYFLQKYI